MKKHLFLLSFFIQVNLSFSQAPVVSNVNFVQRTDGSLIVDIYYDLSDIDGETKAIEIEASDNNGSTWNLICMSLTGDVGAGVTLGTEKHVVWDFYTDNPNISGSSYQVRVTASEVSTLIDIDNNIYQTVKIGEQWWMAENLKVTHYRNGDPIPNITDNSEWINLDTGAYCYSDNNIDNANDYGALYNWFAVDESRNIAPSGWHVPTYEDFTTLAAYLGGTNVAGGKMKETGTTHWNSPNTGATNECGFSARPGGHRSWYNGVFYLTGPGAGYWASYWPEMEEYPDMAHYRELYSTSTDFDRSYGSKRDGFSVRLIRD